MMTCHSKTFPLFASTALLRMHIKSDSFADATDRRGHVHSDRRVKFFFFCYFQLTYCESVEQGDP